MAKFSDKISAKNIKPAATWVRDRYQRRLLTYLHRLWRSKSGSFYGMGYLVTFLVLEVTSFIDEIVNFDFSVGGIATQIIQQILRFFLETLINIVYAFIWPVWVLQWMPSLYGIALLIGLYVAYVLIRKRWDLDEMVHIRSIDRQQVARVLDYCFEKDADGNWIGLSEAFWYGRRQPLPENMAELHQAARAGKLESWRQQPQPCLALMLLLCRFSHDCDAQEMERIRQYALRILDESIKCKLDKELPALHRCAFYLPYWESETEKHKKLAGKHYQKIRKQLGAEHAALVDDFFKQWESTSRPAP